MIFDLPDFILETIQGYLTPRSEHNALQLTHTHHFEWKLLFDNDFDGAIEEDRAWRNLMNTAKCATEIKRKTIYLVLKDSFALSYLEDEVFRQRVDGLLHNRRNQLHISFRQFAHEPFRLRNASWDGCNKITLEKISSLIDLSTVSSVKYLYLDQCVSNSIIYNMTNIETLDLNECDSIETISNCPKLIRLSVVECINLRDISNLTNLRTLLVAACLNLTVPEKTLQSVQYLWLDTRVPSFPNHNITTYKNLKCLSIDFTNVVEDELWQLDNLLFLSFTCCRSIKVTRFPKGLKKLGFWHCTNIPLLDLSQMPDLTSLEFNAATMTSQVIDSSRPLKSLIFKNCLDLTNIYLYSDVKELFIVDAENDNDSIERNSPNITVWIGRKVRTPKLTVNVTACFHLKPTY